jgi:hypothetical protein
MATVKKFKCTYDDKTTGEHVVAEESRLMITADGGHKSLFIGADIVLATVPVDASDEELWTKARANFSVLGRA